MNTLGLMAGPHSTLGSRREQIGVNLTASKHCAVDLNGAIAFGRHVEIGHGR